MKKTYLWPQHLSRSQQWQRIGLSCAAMIGCILLLLVGFNYLHERYIAQSHSILDSLADHLGVTVSVGDHSLNFNELTLKDLEINRRILFQNVKIRIGLNSKSGVLGLVQGVDAEANELNINELIDMGLKHNNDKAKLSQSTNLAEESKKLSQTIEEKLKKLPSDLKLMVATAKYDLGKGRGVIIFKDLNLNFQKKNRLVTIGSSRVSFGDHVFKSDLIARLKLSNGSDRLNILVTTLTKKKNIALKVSALADLDERSLNASFDAESAFLRKLPVIGDLIVSKKRKPQRIFGRIEASSSPTGGWDIALNADGEQLRLQHDRISAGRPLSPLNFSTRISAHFDGGLLKIPEARMRLNPTKANSIAATADGYLGWSGQQFVADLNFNLPQTSCQTVAKFDAKRITPNLKNFNYSGTMAFSINLKRLPKMPYSVSLKSSQFDCVAEIKDGATTIDAKRLAQATGILTAFQKNSAHDVQHDATEYLALHQIPSQVRRIFLASEDISFYQHDGVDFASMASALEHNLNIDRRILGGSTISMQVAKNIYLSGDRTVSRKVEEIFMTHYLEQNLSKDKILELYLNIAEFGPGIYGIKAASRIFFHKTVDQLTPLQITYLAAILPAPVRRYQYFCRNEITPNMRELLHHKLDKLYELDRIDSSTYEGAKSETLSFEGRSAHSGKYCAQGITALKGGPADRS